MSQLQLYEGYIPFEQALGLLTYLHNERDLVVWTTVLAHLKYAIHMFNGDASLMGLQVSPAE